ncbi:MAG: tetratricopeptide repeat protein [Muribaculaceae bacterium]|nr:tetratricopeptide repeat protein [Muribaculaceae bacterium]
MAKENQPETRTAVDTINDQLTGIEQKVQNNQKTIMWACIIVAAIVCAVLIYIYGIRKPGIESANNAIGQADLTMALGNDSLALSQYQQVADEYGYEAGNRAALNAAIILYKQGKYQEALDYLNDYNPTESIIGASSKALEGDCYVNLKNYDKAIDCYRQAAKLSDKNPAYTPYFLMKEATVQRELKNYKAEAELYTTIRNEYPEYAASMQIDFDKYITRAETQAAEAK